MKVSRKMNFFCPAQVLQQAGEHRLAAGKIFHRGVLPGGPGAVPGDVAAQGPGAGVHIFQLAGGLPGQVPVAAVHRSHPAAHPAGGALVAPEQIHQPAEHRRDADQGHPGDGIGGVLVFADQEQDDEDAQRRHDAVEPGGVFGQPEVEGRHPHQLDQDQQKGDGDLVDTAAEDFDDRQFKHGFSFPAFCSVMDARVSDSIPPPALFCKPGSKRRKKRDSAAAFVPALSPLMQ